MNDPATDNADSSSRRGVVSAPIHPREASQTWIAKFRNAFRGTMLGIYDSKRKTPVNSFSIHIPAAVLVLVAGWYRGLDAHWMAILCGCIAMVFVAELFNTSIECLSRAVTNEYREEIRDALDIASGAVWMACFFAMVIGAIAFFS